MKDLSKRYADAFERAAAILNAVEPTKPTVVGMVAVTMDLAKDEGITRCGGAGLSDNDMLAATLKEGIRMINQGGVSHFKDMDDGKPWKPLKD